MDTHAKLRVRDKKIQLYKQRLNRLSVEHVRNNEAKTVRTENSVLVHRNKAEVIS